MVTIDKARTSAHEAIDKIAGVTAEAAEAVSEKGEQFRKTEQRLMENCSGYIRDNPFTSLGIAVAAGFLLSRLLSSR